MTISAVLTILAVMAVGGALVMFPAYLLVYIARERLSRAEESIKDLKKELGALAHATNQIVETERLIDAGRDLDPESELRLLLEPDPTPPAGGPTPRGAGGRLLKLGDHVGDGDSPA